MSEALNPIGFDQLSGDEREPFIVQAAYLIDNGYRVTNENFMEIPNDVFGLAEVIWKNNQSKE